MERRASRPQWRGVWPGDSYTILMIFGLTYIAALLISDFAGCAVALCAAVLLSFGWPARRIAVVMLLAGGSGALAAIAGLSVLLLIIGGSAPPEAFAMWGLGGFGWFGAAAGALAAVIEGVFSILHSSFCILNSAFVLARKPSSECRMQNEELRNE